MSQSKSGLNAKTIYGGEHKNRYLLETTGCGVAFFDYDHDDWLDIFLVNGSRIEGFPKGQEPISHLFKNNRDGTFTDVTAKAGLAPHWMGTGLLRRRLQQRRLERSLRHATTARTFSIATTATEPSPTSPLKPALPNPKPAGTPAAPSSTTTATATSTSSSPTTSTSTSRPHRFPRPRAAPTKASRSPAVLPACKAAKTSSTATTATAPSPTSAKSPACSTPSEPTPSPSP